MRPHRRALRICQAAALKGDLAPVQGEAGDDAAGVRIPSVTRKSRPGIALQATVRLRQST